MRQWWAWFACINSAVETSSTLAQLVHCEKANRKKVRNVERELWGGGGEGVASPLTELTRESYAVRFVFYYGVLRYYYFFSPLFLAAASVCEALALLPRHTILILDCVVCYVHGALLVLLLPLPTSRESEKKKLLTFRSSYDNYVLWGGRTAKGIIFFSLQLFAKALHSLAVLWFRFIGRR